MMRPLCSTVALLVASLAVPAAAFAEEGKGGYTDRTTEIMIGLILILMIAMIVIGILEQRKDH